MTDHQVLWCIPPPTSPEHLKVLLCRRFSTVLYHKNKIAFLELVNSELWSFLLKKKVYILKKIPPLKRNANRVHELGGVYMIPVRVSFWYELSISYRVYMDDTNIDTGMTHEPKQ